MRKILITVLMVILAFGLTSAFVYAVDGSSCSNCEWSTFNGSPACVDSYGSLHICEKNFTDSNFRDLCRKYDIDKNGILTTQEANYVTNADFSGKEICSLKGIEYFKYLKRLNCNNNKLASIDISKNAALTDVDITNNQLSKLDVSNNKGINHLDVSYNDIYSLDLSKNTELSYLNCLRNKLSNLNVSNCIKLGILCSGRNYLTNLDVSGCKNLTELYTYENQLTSLNVANNRTLKVLSIGMNDLGSINVSSNPELTVLSCEANQLSYLDLRSNLKLTHLYCHTNRLSNLDMSKNVELSFLNCTSNQLTSLNIAHNAKIDELYCNSNHLYRIDYNQNNNISYPDKLIFGKQQIENLPCIKTGGVYIVDFSTVLGKTNVPNIKMVNGKSATGTNLTATYNKTSGKAVFSMEPVSITYLYNVKVNFKTSVDMYVTSKQIKPAQGSGIHPHKTVTFLTKASIGKDGKYVNSCLICKKDYITKVIPGITGIYLSAKTYTYDGKVKTPTVVVKNRKGTILRRNVDYTVSYAPGRKSVNKYWVRIVLKGEYTGSKTLYFTISPAKTTLSQLKAGVKKFTVKWKKQSKEITGYQIQYSKSSKFSKSTYVTVNKKSTISKTISKLNAKKTYYVRVRTYKTVKVNGKSTKIYSAWSNIKSVKTKK